jgi:hypothetical protein
VLKSGQSGVRVDEEEPHFVIRPIDCWVLTGGIDRFPIATPDHVDFLGFIVGISPRANPEDRVVIDGVLISRCARLSIRFVGCLTAT